MEFVGIFYGLFAQFLLNYVTYLQESITVSQSGKYYLEFINHIDRFYGGNSSGSQCNINYDCCVK